MAIKSVIVLYYMTTRITSYMSSNIHEWDLFLRYCPSKVENNLCYDHMGHGFFLEDGGELDNVFDGNIAISTRRATGNLEPTDFR